LIPMTEAVATDALERVEAPAGDTEEGPCSDG
jgi:hypothetical protein